MTSYHLKPWAWTKDTEAPSASCVCSPESTEHCAVCGTWSDFCTKCNPEPEPECACVYTDVDAVDARGCELHGKPVRPVSREEVVSLFDYTLAAFRKPVMSTCCDCGKSERECDCDPFAVRRSA